MLHRKGFEDDDIKLLVDDDDDCESPNHINVKNALTWLCTEREDGDIIFMHFSGHGTQVPADDDDNEVDNLDEAIVLEELFLMADDDLKQFFSQLPDAAICTVITDCCHSGTMLDGTEVAIEGSKDEESDAPHEESSSLLETLGGSRGIECSTDRSLPLATICSSLSEKLGTDVQPSASGVNGAMAQIFGGTAGKFMLKFAMSQLSKQDSSGSAGMMGMVSGLMGGSAPAPSSGGNPLSSLMGGGGGGAAASMLSSVMGGGSSGGGSNPLSSLMGGGSGGSNPLSSLMGGGSGGSNPLSSLMGGGSQPQPEAPSSSDNPMAMLSGLMGKIGLQGTDGSAGAAPPYNPNHRAIPADVCVLITGCQSDETSADVRPPGGDAYGALTKTLTDIQASDDSISYYDLVSKVRQTLSVGGFKQNPCLETSEDKARTPFIC